MSAMRLRRSPKQPKPPKPAPGEGGQMTLIEHLAELRARIIRAGLAVTIGVVIVVVVWNPVLRFLTSPYRDLCRRRGEEFCGGAYNATTDEVTLNILDPVEGFTTRLRVAMYGGIVLALPVILWQLWKFIVPALHKNEKRYALGFVLSSLVFFVIGGFVAYLTLERALEFLIEFAGEGIEQEFRIQAYIRLVALMMAAFGVGFTLPVLLVFLQLLGIVSWRTLLRGWRYAVVGIFAVAAMITPSGDPPTLFALSIPMTVLYFAAILIGRIVQRRRGDD